MMSSWSYQYLCCLHGGTTRLAIAGCSNAIQHSSIKAQLALGHCIDSLVHSPPGDLEQNTHIEDSNTLTVASTSNLSVHEDSNS